MTTTTPPSADPWVRRVQALLAKAESTTFPAEAEALLAKAQELIARHSIDEAMLARGASRDAVGTETVTIDSPYAGPKSMLLSAVAMSNSCRVILHGRQSGGQQCIVVGHRSDIDGVRTLFAALSLHATRAMLAAPTPTRESVRGFRHAFLLAFALRIRERLRAAAEAARADVEQQAGHETVALALIDRASAVDDTVVAQFPHLRAVRSQASSGAGLASGREAANHAPLGRGEVSGVRGGLPSA